MRNRRFQVVVLAIGGWLALLSPTFGQGAEPNLYRKTMAQLIQDLSSPRANVRETAAIALEKMPVSNVPCMPMATASMLQKDIFTDCMAAYTLASRRPPVASTLPALMAALKNRDSGVRFYAAFTLFWKGRFAAPAAPALTRVLTDSSLRVSASLPSSRCVR